VLTTLLAASPDASAHSRPRRAASGRPNFVLILTDDLDATTTPYWKVLPKTKRLLADRGLTFTNAFGPTPICCPARTTILTGKYAHNTGVITNGGDHGGYATFNRNGNEQHTVALQLQRAGYRTALIGKYLNGYADDPTHVPPGWTEWYGAPSNTFYNGYDYTLNENGTLVKYGHAPADYSTDVVGRKALAFIDHSAAAGSPFFLYLASTAPHLPLGPPPRYKNNRWAHASVPKTPNYMEPDLSDKPQWLRDSGAKRLQQKGWTERDFRNRMGSLLAVDDMVAALIKRLETKGLLSNTYLVFASDNGYNNGSHRLIHKMAPYEESLRVPLVITGPKIRHGTTNAFALHTDFTPTWLELAGLPIPDDVDGASLVPILRNKTPASWRTDFVAQYFSGGAGDGIGAELTPDVYYDTAVIKAGQEIPTYEALRTSRYLYVDWHEFPAGGAITESELYDLREDPFQLQNLLADPATATANAALVARLRTRLTALLACKGATCRQ